MPPPTVPAPNFQSLNRAMTAYAALNVGWSVVKLLMKRPVEVKVQQTAWRPPKRDPKGYVQIEDKDGQIYIFDAILKQEHLSSLRMTEHPVQNGANIVDHAYQLPERLTLEIGMSDAMDSFIPSQWQEYETKSISAFQKIKELQYTRQPLAVSTRLNTYENMLIEQVSTPDDYKTLHALKCIIALRQIIPATVSNTTVKVSKRSQVTDSTPQGVKQPEDLGSVLSYIIP